MASYNNANREDNDQFFRRIKLDDMLREKYLAGTLDACLDGESVCPSLAVPIKMPRTYNYDDEDSMHAPPSSEDYMEQDVSMAYSFSSTSKNTSPSWSECGSPANSTSTCDVDCEFDDDDVSEESLLLELRKAEEEETMIKDKKSQSDESDYKRVGIVKRPVRKIVGKVKRRR